MSLIEELSVIYYLGMYVFAFTWPMVLVLFFLLIPSSTIPFFISLWMCYFLFIYLDRHTSTTGGRARNHWALSLFPQTLHHVRYFPLKVVKTAELPPTTNYLVGLHPHCPWTINGMHSLSDENPLANELFPNVSRQLVTKPSFFWVPWSREYTLFKGLISCNRTSMEYVLKKPPSGGKSKALMVFVGGGREAYYAAPRSMKVILKRQHGFVRLALRHGTPLVPVITFGENDIYHRVQSKLMVKLEQAIFSFTTKYGFGFALFYGRFGTLMPFAKPITTVVGQPIPVQKWTLSDTPPIEQVEKVLSIYCDELRKLYDDHKHDYGYGDVPLEII